MGFNWAPWVTSRALPFLKRLSPRLGLSLPVSLVLSLDVSSGGEPVPPERDPSAESATPPPRARRRDEAAGRGGGDAQPSRAEAAWSLDPR